MKTIKEIIEHHNKYVRACVLDEVLADYADDAMILTPGGAYHGKEEIAAFFADSFKTCLPPESVWVDDNLLIDGPMAVTMWHAKSPFAEFTFGSDSFTILNEKITYQSFVGIQK